MENNPLKWKLNADHLEVKVRLSIFIITGACAGLPALVWSVSHLIHHRKNGHRISIFIFLLLTDFVELFLSPYILLKYLLDEIPSFKDWTCLVLSSLWWSSRACGLLLNQLVALKGIQKDKTNMTACFSLPCFRIVCILLLLCVCAIAVNPIFFIPLVFIASVIPWTFPCVASCSADRHSHTSRKLDYHILVVFIYTLLLLVLYLTLMLLDLILDLILPLKLSFLFIPYFLTSVRLISDPLLCVLVCRQNLQIQTSQTSEGASLVW